MTKETKIGLLVGLAFIILFAIILSEKGAPQHDGRTPTNFEIAKGQPALPSGSNPTTPLQNDGRVAVERQLDPIVQASKKPSPAPTVEEPIVAVSNVGDEDRLPELPDSVLDLLKPSGDTPSKPAVQPARSTALADGAANRGGAGASAFPTRTETPGPSTAAIHIDSGSAIAVPKSEVAVATGGTITDRPDAGGTGRTDSRSSEHGATLTRTGATETPLVIKTTHTVEQGECITKIASKYYGRSTPERVKAIVDANQDVLKDHRAIRPSDKLRIPELAGYEEKFEPVNSLTQARPVVAVADKSSGTKRPVDDRPLGTAIAATNPPQDGIPRVPLPLVEESKAVTDKTAARNKQLADASTVSEAKSSGKNDKSDKAASNGKFRWYEVRNGDTLSSIARRELGNERKFKTLYQMNRDVIANQHSLKPGTKIRLPNIDESSMTTAVTTGHVAAGAEP